MPKSKKTRAALWEWQDDEGDWQGYLEADEALLEDKFAADVLSFSTKLSFSKDSYKFDLKKLTQTNPKTKATRKLRRNDIEKKEESTKSGKRAKKKERVEEQKWYFKNDDGEWQAFAEPDRKMMEAEYESRGSEAKFTTTDFSFNAKHQTPYLINFDAMTQLNKKSKVSRELRRGEGEEESGIKAKSKTDSPPPGRAHLGEKERAQAGGRVHFSGCLMHESFVEGTCSVPYVEDAHSEYVGIGRYKKNSTTFPKAIGSSFDSVAVDAGTRCVIYEKPDFTGKVLWDKVGPALIVNVLWKSQTWPFCGTKKFEDMFMGEWKEPLNSIFPSSVREFSSSNMHEWNTGSLVIEGGYPIPKLLKKKNPEYRELSNPTY